MAYMSRGVYNHNEASIHVELLPVSGRTHTQQGTALHESAAHDAVA